MTISNLNSDRKQSLREAMPLCTAFLDDMREHFGDPLRLHAIERCADGWRDVLWVAARLRAAEDAIRARRWVQASPPATVMPERKGRV